MKTYFGQFFMAKNMVPSFSIHVGAFWTNLLVAMATEMLKFKIFHCFGCHGNQIYHVPCDHWMCKIWRYPKISTMYTLFHLNWWRKSWNINVWSLVISSFLRMSMLCYHCHISLIKIDIGNQGIVILYPYA